MSRPRYQPHFAAGVLVATLVAGCQSAQGPQRQLLLFPPPPGTPRVQFLTWASGADEVEPGRGSFERFILGDEPVVKRVIQKPYGVAVRDGVAYVCDTKGLNIARLNFAKGGYSVFGVTGPGRLRKPLNIAVDALGYKFVVDSDRQQIVVFGPDDAYVTAFDVPRPCHPVDVAVHEDELFVLDNDESCQVVVMDRASGEVLRTFGGPGGEPGQFKIPNSIAVSPDGFVYVSDTHNWRLQKLTLEGKPVWVVGQPGYMLGQFGRPRGVRVGPDGIVYLVDGATEIVQMFNPEGQTLMRFGGPGSMPGSLGLPATVAVDATSLPYFRKYLHPKFEAQYLLFVTSQVGAHLVSIYAFGKFPEEFKLEQGEIQRLEPAPMEEGIGPVQRAEPPTEERPSADKEPGP